MLTRETARDELSQVRVVIVDEWHELMGNKRGVQVQLAIARLRRWNPALVVPSRELAARIHARWPIAARDREYRGEVAQRHVFEDGAEGTRFETEPFTGYE